MVHSEFQSSQQRSDADESVTTEVDELDDDANVAKPVHHDSFLLLSSFSNMNSRLHLVEHWHAMLRFWDGPQRLTRNPDH
jgi:hypothetical protein